MAAEEKRVYADERRYAIITKDSVKMMAESTGYADISETVAGILGEDASYRLREITQKSAQFMRHAKRRRMNIDDFNKACKNSDIQPVHGHRSEEAPSAFRTTKEGDVHFIEDPEVNLAAEAFNDYVPKPLGNTTIKAHWLCVEGVQKTPQNPQGTPLNTKPEVSALLQRYFEKITHAILSSDSEMMKTALLDLRSNSNISPLLPQFVSFTSNAVKTMNYDLGQLMKVLSTIQSLVVNTSLLLEAQPYLATLLQSVQYCLLEPVSYDASRAKDQWSLRDYAARLLARMVRIWGNSVNHLERFTEKSLREALCDHSRQFCSHYGAVMGLLHLGTQSIERVLLPHLPAYWPHLTDAMIYKGAETMVLQSDAYKTHGAILLCAECVLLQRIKDFKNQIVDNKMTNDRRSDVKIENQPKSKPASTSGFVSQFDKSPCTFYNEISEYFGDSLAARLPELPEMRSILKSNSRKPNLTTSDSEANKSGEQLLEELMEQIKREEETSRKIKEREKYLKAKQERDQVDRTERRRQERELRLADQRRQLLLRKQQQTVVDSDDEIDVEGDNDRSDDSVNSDDGGVDSDLSVKSSIGAPGQGIKLTFTKRSKLTLGHAPQFEDSPLSDTYEMGDTFRRSKKRKRESDSPQEMMSSPGFDAMSDLHSPGFSHSAHFSGQQGDEKVKSHHKKFF